MSASRSLRQLGRLVELREREVERLTSDLAVQHGERERYLGNLARLEQLGSRTSAAWADDANPGNLSPTLSMNSGAYKQAVLKMAESHRLDLALHEATLARTQRLVTEAAQRHKGLDLVVVRKRDNLQRAQNARDQKRQDELASQVWLREQK